MQQLLARIPVTQGISGLDVALAHLVPNLPRQLDLFTRRPARQRFIDLVQLLAARYGADAFYEAMPDQPQEKSGAAATTLRAKSIPFCGAMGLMPAK